MIIFNACYCSVLLRNRLFLGTVGQSSTVFQLIQTHATFSFSLLELTRHERNPITIVGVRFSWWVKPIAGWWLFLWSDVDSKLAVEVLYFIILLLSMRIWIYVFDWVLLYGFHWCSYFIYHLCLRKKNPNLFLFWEQRWSEILWGCWSWQKLKTKTASLESSV